MSKLLNLYTSLSFLGLAARADDILDDSDTQYQNYIDGT